MSEKSSTSLAGQKQILSFIWRTSQPYKWYRRLTILTSVIILLIGTFVGPAIIAMFIDGIQQQSFQGNEIWLLVVYYSMSILISEVIGPRISLYLAWKFETNIQRDIYNQIFAKLTNQTLFFHSNRFSGSLVSQASKLERSVERFWDTVIWAVTPIVVSVVGAVTILWFIFWQYALFLALFSLLFIILVFFGSRFLANINLREARASNKMSGRLADVVSNVLAVKASGAEKIESDEFQELTNNWREKVFASMRGFLSVSTGYSLITALIIIGSLAFASYASQNNIISIATIYLIVTYTSSVARNLWNMNGIMRTYNRIMGDAKDMVDILDDEIRLTDNSSNSLSVTKGAIDINDITYVHDEGDGEVQFSNFSLSITPGQKVGLVGLSGSGKTSLTKLLLRFADLDDGKITIDGQDITEVTQESLRRSIAYVPQEPLLFHRSIRENISYGEPSAKEEEVIMAAKKAGAHQFITGLAKGYDTLVGERGVKLSGGQRQRVAIARAILKDAPILVLDEATSALDSESEKLIQDSLETLMDGRTSIVIAHRLSTIAKMDRIIVLDNGKIIEDGSHSQLLKLQGIYTKLWQHQSGGFINE